MENASKALIIAGAILLSILLISLGLIVYNQAKNTIGNVNLTEQEITAFNSKFNSYEGNNVSGTQVNSLIQAVVQSNIAAARDNTSQFITIQFPTLSSTADANCLTIGVDVTAATPKVTYSNLAAPAADITALTNPQTDGNDATTYALRVSTGKSYIVTMATNSASGLIEKILVKAR